MSKPLSKLFFIMITLDLQDLEVVMVVVVVEEEVMGKVCVQLLFGRCLFYERRNELFLCDIYFYGLFYDAVCDMRQLLLFM